MVQTLFKQRDSPSPEYEHMYNRIMQVPEARQRFDDMWRIFQPYADRNFNDEFSFHPLERFWEMMLTVALLDGGLDVSCPKPGPDICISSAERLVWIEAVAPSSGSGSNGVPIPPENIMFDYPETQIILRFRNALDNKHEGRKKYVEDGIVAADDPYVIALSGGRMNVLIDSDESPAVLKALLPIGPHEVLINTATGKIEEWRYAFRPNISKVNSSPVSTEFFLDSQYSGISAVLFSEANFLIGPTDARSNFLVIHNPIAANPLPQGWLGFGRECIPRIKGDKLLAEIKSIELTGH